MDGYIEQLISAGASSHEGRALSGGGVSYAGQPLFANAQPAAFMWPGEMEGAKGDEGLRQGGVGPTDLMQASSDADWLGSLAGGAGAQEVLAVQSK